MKDHPRTPSGWSVEKRRTTGPFTTGLTLVHPDGRRLEWSSRAHRKRASPTGRPHPGRAGMLWAPRRPSWWIAVLFAVGATCFLLGPLDGFAHLVGPRADAVIFFIGSIFFTSAGSLQWLQAINSDPTAEPVSTVHRRRVLAWQPHRIDFWSSGIQLVGTLLFNVSTFQALSTQVSSPSYDQAVWRPDAFGSVCFLVSGWLAYAEVSGGTWRRPPSTLEGTIVTTNLLGCIAFGISAVAAYVPSGSSEVDVSVANATTALGALGFLIGALLLLPEAVRERSQVPQPMVSGAG